MVSFATAATIGSSLLSGIGGLFGGKSSAAKQEELAWKQHEWNLNAQREFAMNGLQYRAYDAKMAGLHPLYAVGANLPTYSPTSMVGSSDSSPSWGDKLQNLGQGIGRAAQAYQSKDDRAKSDLAENLALEKAKLENDLLRSNISHVNRQSVPPSINSSSLPITGQGNSIMGDGGLVEVLPSQRTSSMVARPATEAAISPANKMFVNADGTLSIWPSSDAKQSIEDSPYEYEHIWKNRVIPYLDEKFGSYFDRQLQRRHDWDNARRATRKFW